MGRIIDMTNQKYNKLTVLSFAGYNKRKERLWLCQCDCGNTKIIIGSCIRQGQSKSCGCLNEENKQKMQYRKLSHGKRYTKSYNIWIGIKKRCYNTKAKAYKNYGGRGVKLCERWHNFEMFYQDMGECPKNMQIDRINNDGDYEPNNCHWTTSLVNGRNRRITKIMTYNNITHTLGEWAEITKLPYKVIYQRLRNKWDIEKILNTPLIITGRLATKMKATVYGGLV